MTLTPSDAAAVTLTGTSPDWVQATDTAGTTLSAQAKNTTTGAVSTQKAGSVKIDTTAPRLTYRAVVGELDIDDSAAVSSGVWKLHRTDATGAVTRASSVAQTFPRRATCRRPCRYRQPSRQRSRAPTPLAPTRPSPPDRPSIPPRPYPIPRPLRAMVA